MIKKLRGMVRLALERYGEWRFGIETDADIGLEHFGITDPECHQYNPTNYRRFRQIMKRIKIRAGEDVFLDFGSGMGRAVILAATYPFRKVIGVEITHELNLIARENVRRALPHLACKDIELHEADAREFPIPHDVNVIYLWNPFGEEVLAKVFENVKKSIQESPREISILYLAPPEVRVLDNVKAKLDWVEERERMALGTHLTLAVCICRPQTA